jgi:hypothetical protein
MLKALITFSAACVAFITGASMAAGIVPIILTSWTLRQQEIFIVISGLLFVPAGVFLGDVLRRRFGD